MSTSSSVSDFEEREISSDIDRVRHSCAHVLAHAVQRLYPEAQFGIGPTIEDGFYYDIDINTVLKPEDLRKIEKEMKKIIGANNEFFREEHSIPDARKMFKNLKQSYKIEIIDALEKGVGASSVSTYREGDFIDLCKGPHIKKTGEIKAFKLLSIAGAYWRGNEKNPQLQRIYGTAFPTKEELDEHLRLLEEAKKRDHRKLGKELDLFSFHPEAPASPFFHPKGATLYRVLMDFIQSLYHQYGYQEVITPQIFDSSLWHKSGHYEHYKENMYFTEVDEREFAIKPMNCPASTFIFSSQKRSYRDLPLRLADFGRLHRYERSGATAGLTRVRSFCQDDAHVFCTPDQIETEIKDLISMIFKSYKIFDFETEIFLSTRPEQKTGSDALWDQAESALQAALDSSGCKYQINPGDGAFYGPKIDFTVQDAIRRKHQLGTIQLDFNLPERFNLNFTGSDNTLHRPVMIHRAVLGSFERFIGVLIEHLAGAFPFWLAPVQARIIPIGEKHVDYCKEFATQLQNEHLRIEIDDRNESMGLKTREVQKAKIPFALVAGDKEVQEKTFSVRKYGEKSSEVLQKEQIFDRFLELNGIHLAQKN